MNQKIHKFFLISFLSENHNENLLEIKAFRYSKAPSFDIANFDSYCKKVKNEPYILYADYLIFGYEMTDVISIEDIWLRKIWEIAGSSKKFPLKTQVKHGKIYNIRPNTNFKQNIAGVFKNEKDFLKAIYDTIEKDKSKSDAKEWKKIFCDNYKKYYNKEIFF